MAQDLELRVKLDGEVLADGFSETLAQIPGKHKGTPYEVAFEWENTGDATATLGDITIGGTHATDCAVKTAPAASLEPGEKTDMVLRLSHPVSGARTWTFSIVTNVTAKNPYNGTFAVVALEGGGGGAYGAWVAAQMFALGLEEGEEDNLFEEGLDPVDIFFDFLAQGVPDAPADVLGGPRIVTV